MIQIQKSYLSFFFGFLAVLLTVHTAYATSPTLPPDFTWFSVQAEFDTTGLPPGVSIKKGDYQMFGQHIGDWSIKNDSATPLYLFKKKIENVNLER